MNGRPLRFFGVTLAGWVAIRGVMLWPTMGPGAIPRALVPAAFADSSVAPSARTLDAAAPAPLARSAVIDAPRSRPSVRPAPVFQGRIDEPPVLPMRFAATASDLPAQRQTLLAPASPIPPPDRPSPDRWSLSAWVVLRGGRGLAPGIGGGQLGGGQAGLRVAYAIGAARRLAIVGRIASPLRGQGREVALGLEWRPTRLPVRLVAEYRVALDGAAGGPAAGLVAGTGPAPFALGFDLETYGQAGVVRRRRAEPFADGAARLSRPLVNLGRTRVDLGLGAWGGAQRGAQRLDIGPSLGVRLPVADKSIRLSLDWRQRVAGHARPGSGPVLVIGGDF